MIGSLGKPNLAVTSSQAYWRAYEFNESVAGYEALQEVKQEFPDRVEVGGAIFQESSSTKWKRVAKKVGLTAAAAAAPALAAVGLFASGILSGGLIPTALFAGAAVVAAVGPRIKDDVKDAVQTRSLGDQTGLSVWHSELDISLPLERSDAAEDGLKHMLAANMKSYPEAVQVVHLSGHGHGANYVAGINGKPLAQALKDASAMADNDRVDVALLDCCYGANFEQMNRFGEETQYVVAFQDAIPNTNSGRGKIPLQKMFAEASDETDARSVAVDLAQVAADFFADPYDDAIADVHPRERGQRQHLEKLRKGTDSTTVAVDLKTMREQLNPALDRVGKTLLKEMERNSGFSTSVEKARRDNQIDAERDLVDLGGFLNQLAQDSSSERLKSDVKKVREALDASLLVKRTGEDFPLSGLSFHSKLEAGRREYGERASAPGDSESLPSGWADFRAAAFG